MLYFIIFVIIIIYFVPRWHNKYIERKNITDHEPKEADVAIYKENPETISIEKLQEFLEREINSISALHLNYTFSRSLGSGPRHAAFPRFSVWTVDVSNTPSLGPWWRASRISDSTSLNNYIAIAKPWFVRLAKMKGWDVYESVENRDQYAKIIDTKKILVMPLEKAFSDIVSSNTTPESFHVRKTEDGSYEFYVGMDGKPISKLLIGGEITFFDHKKITDMISAISTAADAPIAWRYSKQDIVGFGEEAGTYGIYISTLQENPKKIFALRDENMRKSMVDFLNSWLKS